MTCPSRHHHSFYRRWFRCDRVQGHPGSHQSSEAGCIVDWREPRCSCADSCPVHDPAGGQLNLMEAS